MFGCHQQRGEIYMRLVQTRNLNDQCRSIKHLPATASRAKLSSPFFLELCTCSGVVIRLTISDPHNVAFKIE